MGRFTNLIKKTYIKKKERGWDTIYWAVDIHDTIIPGNYKAGDIPKDFYPFALICLQLITERTDSKLILFTCSHPHEIEQYKELFESHGIKFDFVNENTESENTSFGCFDKKFYFNIMLEDKAAFVPEEDWEEIMDWLYENRNK